MMDHIIRRGLPSYSTPFYYYPKLDPVYFIASQNLTATKISMINQKTHITLKKIFLFHVCDKQQYRPLRYK
jgi:hypothetical protein